MVKKRLKPLILLLAFLSLSFSQIATAQNDLDDVPSEALFIVYDDITGVSQLLRVSSENDKKQVLFELQPISSRTATDSFSRRELEAIRTVLGDDDPQMLDRNLAQRLRRSWLVGENDILLEIEYSVCSHVPQGACFGYTEYGTLSDSYEYQPVAIIDYHGEIHRQNRCSYQEILSNHSVKVSQGGKSIMIGVAPRFPCDGGLEDVYTLILEENPSGGFDTHTVRDAVGLSVGENYIAYYQLDCTNFACTAVLTITDKHFEVVLSSEAQPTTLSQALPLDTIWLDETTVFYQHYHSEPQPHFGFYKFSMDTGKADLVFSDYTPWQEIYEIAGVPIGFSLVAQSLIASEPFMFLSTSVSKVLHYGPNYLVFAEGGECVDQIGVLDASLSTKTIGTRDLFDTPSCILDITFLDTR